MKAAKLMDEAKEILGLHSDYQLAKALQINSGLLTYYRQGKRRPDAYACGRLAEVLNRDPMGLIAEIEAEHERNATRAAWWKRFLSSLPRSTVMMLAALLTWGGSWQTAPEGRAEAKGQNEALCKRRLGWV